MSDKYPWEECPRCKAIFTGTWDSLNAKIVHCNCTQGIGGDFEQAKIDWLANEFNSQFKIKPYYQDSHCTIYHGDCRDILPSLKRVDLVLTDPPYGIDYKPLNKKYDGSLNTHTQIMGDKNEMSFSFLFTLGKNQIIWGAENFYSQLPHRGRWICWHKRTGSTKDNSMFSSDFELAWISLSEGYYKFFRVVHGGVINANSASKGNNDPRVHPTEKPISLMRKCIELFPEAQTILDPFMGSGTTLRAAKDLNRKCIGIELEEKYCEIAARRLAQEVLLF